MSRPMQQFPMLPHLPCACEVPLILLLPLSLPGLLNGLQEDVDAMLTVNGSLLDGGDSLERCLHGVGHLLSRPQIMRCLQRDPGFLYQVHNCGRAAGGRMCPAVFSRPRCCIHPEALTIECGWTGSAHMAATWLPAIQLLPKGSL